MTRIAGVKFSLLENSALFSDEPLILIMAINEAVQSISITDADANLYGELFERFRCVSLILSATCGDVSVDFATLPGVNEIKRLVMHLSKGSQVGLPAGCDMHELRKLELIFPKHFSPPVFRGCKKLESLISAGDWKAVKYAVDCSRLVDLRLLDFQEESFSNFSHMDNLQTIRIDKAKKLKSFTGLESLKSMKSLQIHVASDFEDGSAITRSESIENVSVWNNRNFLDFSFLKNKALKSITLEYVDAVEWMMEVPGIQFIYCRRVRSLGNKSFWWTVEHEEPDIGKKFEPVYWELYPKTRWEE